MSLASERHAGQLVCTCPQPIYHCVVLFDSIHLTDLYECARCGRKIVGCPTRPPSDPR